MSPIDHQLANSELAVMEALWDRPSQSARELLEGLYTGAKKSQHGTVQRLLQRLMDKGFVRRARINNVFQFSATIAREEYANTQFELLAERLMGGSVVPLLTHLVEAKKVSAEDIARLRGMLAEHDDAEETQP